MVSDNNEYFEEEKVLLLKYLEIAGVKLTDTLSIKHVV